MKRVRCPKCDKYITFDDTQYAEGQSLIFECEDCHKQFGVRIGVTKLRNKRSEEVLDEHENSNACGSVVVIENVFHYKQIIPLKMGDNTIGRYVKGTKLTAPIETNDPSIDTTHCIINVQCNKKTGTLIYTLRDATSNTGTFYMSEIINDHERLQIEDGGIITIGATTLILRAAGYQTDE